MAWRLTEVRPPAVGLICQSEQESDRALKRSGQFRQPPDIHTGATFEIRQSAIAGSEPHPGKPRDDLLLGQSECVSTLPEALGNHEMPIGLNFAGSGCHCASCVPLTMHPRLESRNP